MVVKAAALLFSLPTVYGAAPTIDLDKGVFTGSFDGVTESFLGIPFAQPPVGNLRFRPPLPNAPYSGSYNATAFGPACIQQPTSPPGNDSGLNPIAIQIYQRLASGVTLEDDEDCLSINVIKPANTTSRSNLPVVYWVYGGAFEVGASSLYNGTVIVERSLEIGMPVVYVSVNYRLSALGFPQGKETREAENGNLGLLDQRQGLRWVQQYISEFGGDPSKVTIWGESAGAASVTSQMLINNGDTEGLFRATFAQSGSPVPTGTVDDNQITMDQFATAAGCGASLGSAAVYDCLRNVSVDDIRAGMNATPNQVDYQSLALAWYPAADGLVLPMPYQQLILHSGISNTPLVSGDCDDEGTLFALSNSNITTSAELKDYIVEFWASGNRTGAQALLEAYPEDPAQGSPFDTGDANTITPQFKRISALSGDLVFQAPRRFFLRQIAEKQPVFAFLSKRSKSTPVLGAAHGSDLQNVFGPGDMTDYLIRFAATLDPNGRNSTPGEIEWPRYTLESPKMLAFLDGNVSLALTDDTYRKDAMDVLIDFSLANPLP